MNEKLGIKAPYSVSDGFEGLKCSYNFVRTVKMLYGLPVAFPNCTKKRNKLEQVEMKVNISCIAAKMYFIHEH